MRAGKKMAKFSLIVRCKSDGDEFEIGTVEADAAPQAILSLAKLMIDVATHLKTTKPLDSED